MKKINLNDGTSIYCLKQNEAIVLDEHIKGYLNYDVKVKNGDTIIDVGANIGVFGLRLSNIFKNINIHAFEPIPEIFKVLEKTLFCFSCSRLCLFTAHNTDTSLINSVCFMTLNDTI